VSIYRITDGNGPKAVTVAEYVWAIFCQVTGACLYAAIFGNIATLLAKLDAPGARYRAQRDKIDEFIAFNDLPSSLTSKLHAYCKFLFAVNHGFDVGQISGALPPNLQHQLLLHLHAPLVRSVPMFEQCDDAFIKAIVLQLRPQVLLSGDSAFKAHEVGTEMYFIMRGEMRMMDESLTVCYNTLYSGAYFGELAMLTGQPRTATAYAVTDCVLFYINQNDFERIARKWPKAFASILAKAKERLERVASSNSTALAQHLGDRLTQLKVEADSDTGILGHLDRGRMTTGPGTDHTHADPFSTPRDGLIGTPRDETTPGSAWFPHGSPAARQPASKEADWIRKMDEELRASREMQQLILRKLEKQTHVLECLQKRDPMSA
jgi:CRP-like cAMP-binding protein